MDNKVWKGDNIRKHPKIYFLLITFNQTDDTIILKTGRVESAQCDFRPCVCFCLSVGRDFMGQ